MLIPLRQGVLNWIIFFAHMLTYFPTLALSNTIAMKNMTNRRRSFPGSACLGTIGWIVAGLLVGGFETNVGMFFMIGASPLGLFTLFPDASHSSCERRKSE